MGSFLMVLGRCLLDRCAAILAQSAILALLGRAVLLAAVGWEALAAPVESAGRRVR